MAAVYGGVGGGGYPKLCYIYTTPILLHRINYIQYYAKYNLYCISDNKSYRNYLNITIDNHKLSLLIINVVYLSHYCCISATNTHNANDLVVLINRNFIAYIILIFIHTINSFVSSIVFNWLLLNS